MPPVVAFGVPLGRRAVPPPLRLAGFGIDRLEEAGEIVEVARDADDHVIAHDQRRHGGPVAALRIGHHDVPAHRAVLRVEADQVRVGRHEVEPVAIHGNAARADVEALVRRIGVVPDLMAGARIHRPDVVRRGEVEDAIDQQRRRFDLRIGAGLEGPGERQACRRSAE